MTRHPGTRALGLEPHLEPGGVTSRAPRTHRWPRAQPRAPGAATDRAATATASPRAAGRSLSPARASVASSAPWRTSPAPRVSTTSAAGTTTSPAEPSAQSHRTGAAPSVLAAHARPQLEDVLQPGAGPRREVRGDHGHVDDVEQRLEPRLPRATVEQHGHTASPGTPSHPHRERQVVAVDEDRSHAVEERIDGGRRHRLVVGHPDRVARHHCPGTGCFGHEDRRQRRFERRRRQVGHRHPVCREVAQHHRRERPAAEGTDEPRRHPEERARHRGVAGRPAGGHRRRPGHDLLVGPGQRLDDLDDVDGGEPARERRAGHRSQSAIGVPRSARLTAERIARSEALTIDSCSPTPQSTRSPTAHSTYAAARASPPADRACSW